MKINKKFYGIILSLAMMLSAISPAFAAVVNYGEELSNMPDKYYDQTFSDVPKSHWAFECIEEMVDRKVLAGFPDGKFYPDNNVTRAQFAKIMVAAAGMPLTLNLQSSYNDVETTDWYSPYIESARYYLSGYVNNGKSYYYPNSNALREDIAVALVKLKGYDTTGYDLSILQTMFSDWKSISTGARPYVAVAVENELISGYDDGTFKGQQGITRAEASVLLWRAYQYGNNNKDFEQDTSSLEKEDLTPEPTATPKPTKEPEKEVIKPTEEPEIEEPEETETPEPEKTPEPKSYGWKVSTIKNGIDNAMNIQAIPDGVIFSDRNKVFHLNDNGKLTTIFDADEYPYQGTEELSRRTEIKNKLETIAYNRNDGNIYALIDQDPCEVRPEFLYNITLDETQASINTGDVGWCHGRFNRTCNLYFYENGDFLVGGDSHAERYSSDGCHIEKIGSAGAYESIIILNNKLYSCNSGNQGIRGIDCDNPMWTDVYDHSGGTYSMPGYDKFYGNSLNKEITTLDINGDVGFLLSFDDIENEEARTFSLEQVIQYGAISDDESRLYFYDNAYGSIRLIQRNK